MLQITTTSDGTVGPQASAVSGASISATRTYRRRAVPTSGAAAEAASAGAVLHWVLESVEQRATVPGPHGSSTVRSHTTYQYVAAHINRGRDESREKALREAALPTPALARRDRALDGHGAPAGGEVMPASIDGINVCETEQSNLTRTVSPGGGGVVYQHGFCGDATTWSAMRQRVPESHRVGVEQIYSLNADAPIESQVDDLTNRLVAAGFPATWWWRTARAASWPAGWASGGRTWCRAWSRSARLTRARSSPAGQPR